MLTPEQKQHNGHRTVGFRKGISTKDAAFTLTDSVFISINKKKAKLEELEEFSVIWQRLLIV
jgi:hypothetical protein